MNSRHYPKNFRFIFVLTAFFVLTGVVLKYSDTASSQVTKETLTTSGEAAFVLNDASGSPKIKLQNGYALPTEYETARPAGEAVPRGLTTADFDVDGYPDLVSAYATERGGYLVFQRGNPESFAPTLPENVENTNKSRFGMTFLPDAKTIELADAPDFIVTGDFDRDNRLDILTAKRGGAEVYLTRGNGAGGFNETRKISLPGTVTALAAGQVDAPDSLTDAVIGVANDKGAALLVYEGANGLNDKPLRYELSSPADLLVVGQMDNFPAGDVAILANGGVSILHGRNQREGNLSEQAARFENITLSFNVKTLALGEFIWDREGRYELALLREDGSVAFLTQGAPDTRPFTVAENRERRRQQWLKASEKNDLTESLKEWNRQDSPAWRVSDELQVMDASAVRAADSTGAPLIFAARLSGEAADDLVALDAETQRIKIFAVDAPQPVNGEFVSFGGERVELALPMENAPVAALSMRTSLFVRPGLVVLREGDTTAQIVPSAPSATFTVTKTADTNDGACNADCSLREAHVAANGAAGADMITVPAGTYTLTIAGNDDGAAQGDLDATGDTTVSGAGAATTIVQAGTTNSNGIDKVVGFNPLCVSPVSGTINNVTVRFGNNTQPDGSPDFSQTGGGMDFCSSGNGATFSVTNSTFDQNTVNNSHGGGINIDSVSPSAHTINLTGVTVSGNDTVNSSGGGSVGGGIHVSGGEPSVTITNSTITGNRARLTGVDGRGGGVAYRINSNPVPSSLTINNSTVSNNNASSSGGGIANIPNVTSTTLSVNNTVISGNTSNGSGAGARAEGGGYYAILLTGSPTQTITESTFTGNTAVVAPSGGTHIGGGGLALGQSNVTVSFSRITGNTATSGSGLRKDNNPGTATATNNWWGCSGGPGTTGCDTAVLQAAPAVLTTTPFLQLRATASPTSLVTGQPSTVTASFLTNSAGTAIAVANLDALIGVPIAFNGVGGNISGAQTTIQATGTATVTYTPTAAAAGNSATAVVDGGPASGSTNTVALTVGKANTTASITGNSPNPSNVGQNVTVTYSVSGSAPGGGTPGGNVLVSDGVNSCTGTVAAGNCQIALSTAGSRTLTATYQGDANYNASPASTGVSQTVGQVTWTGATNTTFATNTNWNTGLAPGSADTVIIPAGAGNQPTISGAATVASLSVAAGRTLTVNSTLTVSGTLTNNGTIQGTGTIVNNFTNGASGAVAPGLSPGILNITGNYTNSGAFNVEIGGTGGAGTNPNGHDQLLISGTATIGGTLNVTLTNGFTPVPGNQFVILDAATSTGTFTTTNLPNIAPNQWAFGYDNAAGRIILGVVPATAAEVSIGGRVFSPEGRGIANARVVVTDSNGVTRTGQTTSFGNYRVEGLAAGQTYTVSVRARGYSFAPRILTVSQDVSDADFTAEDAP